MIKTPKELNLPSKFKQWWPGQGELIQEIADSSAKIFLLDVPTGFGKTLIGIATHRSRILSEDAKEVLSVLADKSPREFRSRCLFVTRTKQLQDQLLFEFPWAKTIKGRRNYRCLVHPTDFPDITAEDCTHSKDRPCKHRGSCPYKFDKDQALAAPLAVLNTSYFIAELNGPGMFKDRELVIIDEVDSLENELMNHIQLVITTKQLERLGISLPEDSHSLQGWLVWAEQLNLTKQTETISRHLESVPDDKWTDVELDLNKRLRRLDEFRQKIATFLSDVNSDWLFEEEKTDKQTKWIFRPVLVANYAEKYVWQHAKRFLCMSGTILAPKVMAADLGIPETDYDYTMAESPFQKSARAIYYRPVANLTQKNLLLELPKTREAMLEIMEKYNDQKILVHTTSFHIRNYLMETINDPRLMTHDTAGRNDALEAFKRSAQPKVMLSPSFDRGIDLPDNFCRCIIICKVPYMSLGDKQVRARMNMPGGEFWYLLKTVQTIMQMTGRGVRNHSDYCDAYILDKQFGVLFGRMSRYIPAWWKDALIR